MVDYVPPLMPFVIERIEQEKPIPPSVMYMVKKSGYDYAKYSGEWNGYQVFSPGYSDNLVHYTRYPHRILKKNNKLRWTTDEESIILLRKNFN